MSTNAFKPRQRTLLNDWKLPHPSTEQPMPGGKYPAQVMFEQKNNGDIVFKISDGVYQPGAKNTHKEIVLDLYHRGLIFEAVLDACNNPNFTSKAIPLRWKDFVGGSGGTRMSEQPITHGNFMISLDDKQRVCMTYSKGDYRAPIVFRGPKDSTCYIKGPNGEKIEDHASTSRYMARTWVNFHQQVLAPMEMEGTKEKYAKEAAKKAQNSNQFSGGGNGGNGGGSNWNNNNSNGGGNSGGGSEPDFDDNIPF